jgi:hypothetical protein
MERIKILFSYFGQPRMVEETSHWHDEFISYLKDNDFDVDLQYHLWDCHEEFNFFPQNKLKNFIKVDKEKLTQNLSTNRVDGCNISLKFYSYDLVENFRNRIIIDGWEPKKQGILEKSVFNGVFSQPLIKYYACQDMTEDYDMVVLLRTDLIFNKYKYEKFVKTFKAEYKNLSLKQKNVIYIPWMRYRDGFGFYADDQFLVTNSHSLKLFNEDINHKIISFIENTENFDPHYVAFNFGLFYKRKEKEKVIVIEKHLSNLKTIARPRDDVKRLLNDLDSFDKIDKIFQQNKSRYLKNEFEDRIHKFYKSKTYKKSHLNT